MGICQRCGEVKSFSEFFQREDRVGVYAWCLKCMRKEGRLKHTKHSQLQEATGYIK